MAIIVSVLVALVAYILMWKLGLAFGLGALFVIVVDFLIERLKRR